MKSLVKSIILASLSCGAANAAVTVSFSNASAALTNFNNGAGVGNTNLVWGILVDTAGNGFAGGTGANFYDQGFSLNATTTALTLTANNGLATDDRLFLAPGQMALSTTIDSGGGTVNRILSMASMNMANGVNFGQSYAIIWFDSTTRVTTTQGMKYGIFVPPATVVGIANTTTVDKLPGADGTFDYAPVFAGADSAKSMSFSLGGAAVPEPSAALLGALGALGLLRRRRI